ncbi:Patched domain-containing protein 3 [Frankliniella fusca]|uniref:Patched domain-containing protein 3 n=1 Tax=Frankliniella fusca TaxID=407009 RepID=A0AAE1LQ71_9NEOP|nr:Patched domain-containing protein 3 [Frankliniella fusca]
MNPDENPLENHEANNNGAQIVDAEAADGANHANDVVGEEDAVNPFLLGGIEMVNQEIQDQVGMELMEPDLVDNIVVNNPQISGQPQPSARVFRMQYNCMSGFIGLIEASFDRHGQIMATHPKRCIIVSMLIILVSLNGLIFFRQEKNPLNLWIPQHSDFYSETKWLMEEFGNGLRVQTILITAPDVLQPAVMNQLLNIHLKLVNSSLSPSWQDVCFKVPIISFNLQESRKRRNVEGGEEGPEGSSFKMTTPKAKQQTLQLMMTDENFDPSLILGREFYCNIVSSFPSGCLSQSIVDIWKFNVDQVNNLTKAKIIADLNSTNFSPTLGHPFEFSSLLGGIDYDENGVIISAKALMVMYMVHINFSTVDMDVAGNDGGTADWANGPGLEWESNFLRILSEFSETVSGFELYYEAGRSFGDISAAGMFQDMDKLVIGVILMLIYIQAQQTRASCVTSRMIPAMVGLFSIGIAFLMTIAICSAINIPYGPVHTSLPFLLLGIGVDDMFVISSCWNALPIEDKISSIPVRMGLTLRHAGLSISVTSATDVVAFLIGSLTALPSLSSFCLYAALGILITYILQITLYVIALALDQKRIEAGRNFLIPCIKQATPKLLDMEYIPHSSKTLNYIYSKFIITNYGKKIIIAISGLLLATSMYGTAHLRQNFKTEWFLDDDSYLYKFLERRNEYFPDIGSEAGFYFGQLEYNKELQNIGNLVENLKQQNDTVAKVYEWWSGFQRYVAVHNNKDIRTDILSDQDFKQSLSDFLFSPTGARYQKNFKFSEILVCGKPAPNITVSYIEFHFKKFKDSPSSVIAMNKVKSMVLAANLTTGDQVAFAWSKAFANWVTDEIILQELSRNLSLAAVAVAVTTLIFLGSASAVCCVIFCAGMVLHTVMGVMYFWGMSIELVSTIGLVLAVGLTVDFTAHITSTFLRVGGSGDERAIFAVTYMGGAVLHGGVTTLLALSMLVFSRSYIFTAFFKIFLLVILSGLFYGLLFLPVVLSVTRLPVYYVREINRRRNTDQSANAIEIPTPPDRPATGRGL